MNIKEFADLMQVSPHTLRYYEKIGLLKHIQRSASGHRVYTNKDKEWLSFIIRLKETSMPLEAILKYASLRELGAETAQNRQNLLESHREKLKRHIDVQLSHLAALENKIQLYKDKKVS